MSRQLHTCWLVDSWKPSRDKYIRAWQAAGWDVTLWHCGQLDTLPEASVTLGDARELMARAGCAEAFAYEMRHRSHAAAADLFRFAVLYELGGSYVDLDILPHNARAAIDLPLFGQPQGVKPAHMIPVFGRPPTAAIMAETLEIRFVSAPPKHPLIARIVERQLKHELAFIASGGYKRGIDRIVARTGPVMAELVVRGYAREMGIPLARFSIPQATIDETPENEREHMTDRYPEILAAAKRCV